MYMHVFHVIFVTKRARRSELCVVSSFARPPDSGARRFGGMFAGMRQDIAQSKEGFRQRALDDKPPNKLPHAFDADGAHTFDELVEQAEAMGWDSKPIDKLTHRPNCAWSNNRDSSACTVLAGYRLRHSRRRAVHLSAPVANKGAEDE